MKKVSKQQVVFIHGAEAFSTYEDFLSWLKTTPVENPFREEERSRSWKHTLIEGLGEACEVALLSMPNTQNAKYKEWKIWFERHFEFLHDGVILIGHSQGGYFLAKYLTENTMPVRIKALFLIAAPFEPDDFEGEDGGDFHFDTAQLGRLATQSEQIFIYHAQDDPIVPYSHAERYKAALPDAELVTFEQQGHFIQEEFPELIAHVRRVTDATE